MPSGRNVKARIPGRTTLSSLRKRVIPRKVSDYSSPLSQLASPESRLFFKFLRKEVSNAKLKGKKVRFAFPVFVGNVLEAIALLPLQDSYRKFLIEELKKHSEYKLSPDSCEVAVRSAYLRPPGKGGKKTPVWYIFVGKKLSQKKKSIALRRIARKMVDLEYSNKITTRYADQRLKNVLVFR